MPKKDTVMDGVIRARCDKRLEYETKSCAAKKMMDLPEYIRAAVREKNEKSK